MLIAVCAGISQLKTYLMENIKMNKWTPYNLTTRKQIKWAGELAIKYNDDKVKIITNTNNMQHYIMYNCMSIVKEFQILR